MACLLTPHVLLLVTWLSTYSLSVDPLLILFYYTNTHDTRCCQVKELGLLGFDCECLAEDLQRLFDIYWYLSTPTSSLPPDNKWPIQYSALYNMEDPAYTSVNYTQHSNIFFAVSLWLRVCELIKWCSQCGMWYLKGGWWYSTAGWYVIHCSYCELRLL